MPGAAKILQRNVFGWFVRAERGVYALTDAGRAALVQWHAHLPVETAGVEAKTLEAIG